jgi:hypothetical protein
MNAYRLSYIEYETIDGTTHYRVIHDTEYYDPDEEWLIAYARKLANDGHSVRLRRRNLVPQPPWEDVQIESETP